MTRTWARLRRLTPGELVFLARISATATATAALLQAAPLPWVARITRRRGPIRLPVPEEARLVALTDRLLALDRGPLRPNCLVRSLVLLRYLEPPVALKVGVRPGVRPVDGHAWLEREGAPLHERTDPRPDYLVTWSWP